MRASFPDAEPDVGETITYGLVYGNSPAFNGDWTIDVVLPDGSTGTSSVSGVSNPTGTVIGAVDYVVTCTANGTQSQVDVVAAVPPTTTVEPPPTDPDMPTTTDAPLPTDPDMPTTTTEAPPSTDPNSTSTVAPTTDPAPSTTVPAATTTTLASGSLPQTGGSPENVILFAMMLVSGGGALTLFARRRMT